MKKNGNVFLKLWSKAQKVSLFETHYLSALIYFWWGFYSSSFVNKSTTKRNRNTNMNCKLSIIPSTEKLDKISTIPIQILSTIYFSSLFHSAFIINYRLVLYLRQPSPSSEVLYSIGRLSNHIHDLELNLKYEKNDFNF